jgi:hypothetical protein
MANPAKTIKLEDKEVAYSFLAAEGKKGKKDENEVTIAVKMTKKEKKAFLEEVEALWEDSKTNKVTEPAYAFDDWFSEDQNDDKMYVLWVNNLVSNKLALKRAAGTSFTRENFDTLGSGSVVDVEVRSYYWNNKFGEGVSIALSGVLLKEYVEFSGGGGQSLEGEEIVDMDVVEESKPKKDKKDKKKKKKKEKLSGDEDE